MSLWSDWRTGDTGNGGISVGDLAGEETPAGDQSPGGTDARSDRGTGEPGSAGSGQLNDAAGASDLIQSFIQRILSLYAGRVSEIARSREAWRGPASTGGQDSSVSFPSVKITK